MISAQNLIEKILTRSTTDDCIVIVSEKTSANLRWAISALTTNGVIQEQSVTVIAFVAVNGSMATGGVTRTHIDESDIDTILEEARAAALAAGAAEDFAPLARDISLGDWNAPHSPTGPDVFATFAPELGDMLGRSKSDAIELFGYAEHAYESIWVGSKGGLRLRHDSPIGRVEMTGKSHQRSRSTWSGMGSRDFKDVKLSLVDKEIRERLDWQARKIDLPAGRYETVLPSGAVADILVYMMWMAGGREAYEGQSVFSKQGGKTRVGEKLSNVGLQLFSDPHHPGLTGSPFVSAPVSTPFSSVFDNGQKRGRIDWFKDGVLQSLVQTRATAALTSLPYTPISDNLVMSVDGGDGGVPDLVKRVNHGLLLTTLWYIRMVDPNTLLLTGLTRDGVYYVKDGEVQGATNNFRWNDSPVSALSRVVYAGATEHTQCREWAGEANNMAVPPLVIKDFNMSTVSPGS